LAYHRQAVKMVFFLLCFWSAQTAAAQSLFPLGMMQPSDTRLSAPASAALIIQRCYRCHCRHASIRSTANHIQVWYRTAIIGAHTATHTQSAALASPADTGVLFLDSNCSNSANISQIKHALPSRMMHLHFQRNAYWKLCSLYTSLLNRPSSLDLGCPSLRYYLLRPKPMLLLEPMWLPSVSSAQTLS